MNTKKPAQAGFFFENTSFKRNLKSVEMNHLFSVISFFTITAAATIKAIINASSTYPPKNHNQFRRKSSTELWAKQGLFCKTD
ncbi:hypothetical protein CGT98_14445 [Vibrio metoecus]|nr:hypothetical protein CGT98_14445 [Vibrio metoecus]